MRHDPFGQRLDERLEPSSTNFSNLGGVRRGFTGHEQDDDLGWINASGRIYDPNTARFLTPDPVWHPEISQGLNPFSYVRNRPLTLIDPSGFDALRPLPPPQPGNHYEIETTPETGPFAVEIDADGSTGGEVRPGLLCSAFDCSAVGASGGGSSDVGASDDGGYQETAPANGNSLSPRFDPFSWAAGMALVLAEDGLPALYQFLIGDDLDTLSSPDASAGDKALAAAGFLPIGKILKGLKWAGRLGGTLLDLLRRGARVRADRVARLSDDALKHLAPEVRRSVRAWEKRLAEHRDKLAAYRRDPDAFDNKGFLQNAPTPEIRQRIIESGIRHLEREIHNFEKQIADAVGATQ